MKKLFPLGNKIDQLIKEAVDEVEDVPNLDYGGEYETQVPLAGLPKGGYGYKSNDMYSEDDETPVSIPKKKKRKVIEELPPKENYKEKPEVEFDEDEETDEKWDEFEDDWDDEEELNEQKKVKDKDKKSEDKEDDKSKDPGAQQPDQDPNAMIDPKGTGGEEEETTPDPNTGAANAVNMGGMDPNAMGGMDPNAAGGMIPGQDPNAMGGMGMGMEGPPPKTAEEIGRIFELKKIYARLLAVEEHLSFSSDELLLKLRDFVSQTIELFETLISNIDSFKDQIDDIIVMFYKFIEYSYSIMSRYYKVKEKQDQKQIDKSKLFTKFPSEKDDKKVKPGVASVMLKLTQGGM
jgi:hypothetical protein